MKARKSPPAPATAQKPDASRLPHLPAGMLESMPLGPTTGKRLYPLPGMLGEVEISDREVLTFLARVIAEHENALLDLPCERPMERAEMAQAIVFAQLVVHQNGFHTPLEDGSSRALETAFGLPVYLAAPKNGGRL